MNRKLYIKEITHYHPDAVIDNHFFESILDTKDEWIRERVGIQARRWMADYRGDFPVFEISRRAVEKLCSETKLDLKSIDLIISCSSTDDLQYPSTANLLGEYFHLEVPAFHLRNGCSSVLFGLEVASGLFQTGKYRNILLVNGEPFTRQVDYGDRKSSILFGDAATAMVLSVDDGLFEIGPICLGGRGSRAIHSGGPNAIPQVRLATLVSKLGGRLACDSDLGSSVGCFTQEGKVVFDFVTQSMPNEIRRFLKQNELLIEDLDYFIGHQANLSMLKAVCTELGVAEEKHLRNIESCGNTSSAGWVTVLSQENQKRLFRRNDRILVSVFGAGFAWATTVFTKT